MPTEIKVTGSFAPLDELAHQVDNLKPFLSAVGEDLIERARQRFTTATGPDGVRWKSNTRVTIMKYLQSRGAFSGKTGKINAKGQVMAATKRPLQGQSGDLARQFLYQATDDSVTAGSTMIYAAMQQFGGLKSVYAHLWGDIPARQFLPITAEGELYQSEADLIVEQLRSYLIG